MKNPAQTVWGSQVLIDQCPLGEEKAGSRSQSLEIKALTSPLSFSLSSQPPLKSDLLTCICMILSWHWITDLKIVTVSFMSVTVLHWARRFDLKCLQFISGPHGVFRNSFRHFCKGLVVALVMPQCDTVNQHQRPHYSSTLMPIKSVAAFAWIKKQTLCSWSDSFHLSFSFLLFCLEYCRGLTP